MANIKREDGTNNNSNPRKQNQNTNNGQYSSITTVPPVFNLASSTSSGHSAASDDNVVNETAPLSNNSSSRNSIDLSRPSGNQSPAYHSAKILSISDSEEEEAPNLPFTYSGVFSQGVWQQQQHQGYSSSGSSAAGNLLEEPMHETNYSQAVAQMAASFADKRDNAVQQGHRLPGAVAGASSALAHCHMPGSFLAGGSSSEDEDDSNSDSLGFGDSDSESESYEGLAVDDVNETYDHSLPEYVHNEDPYAQTIYLEEEGIQIDVQGMSYNPAGLWLYGLASIMTCGLFTLLCRWIPRWRIKWTMCRAPLGEADFVVIVDEFGTTSIERIHRHRYGGTLESIFGTITRKGPLYQHNEDMVQLLSMFSHRYYRFVYHPYLEKFLSNACWMDSEWTRRPTAMRGGLPYDIRQLRETIFGDNSIDIKESSIGKLLIDEVLNPFYVFQAGSVILWCFDNYYYYASCILLISMSGIIETLMETRRNTRKIKEMAHFTCSVRILRDGAWSDGTAEDLLPGDVFEVVSSMHVLPCDAVLLEGDCIVNESMLTGESVPVAKVPVVPAIFGKMRLASSTFGSDIAKHVLFSGTRLVRVKKTTLGFGGNRWLDYEQRTGAGIPAKATAMVLRTGFNTTKGALIRSILFPRPNKFKFYEDSFKFIGILAIIAVLGFLASIGNFVRLGLTAHIITVRALDLITVVVPPALPATMSIGVSFALARLRKRHIYCISPTRINVCGKISVMCFDKTGTLTEEGLDVLGVSAVDYDACKFTELQENPSELEIGSATAPGAPSSAFNSVGSTFGGMGGLPGGLADLDRSSSSITASSPRRTVADPSKLCLMHALATCHAVKLVNGELVGDPLDVKMFESTGWALEEGDDYNGSLLATATKSTGKRRAAAAAMPVPTVVRPPNSERFSLDFSGGSVYELGVIRTFDFSAALRRQSVIAKRLGARYNEVYVKGAPEAIRELCFSDTIPRDFDQVLLDYTNHGYRVIAMAGKPIKMSWPKLQRLKRDMVEDDLIFMGFLVFENKLKPTTAPVLDELRGAKIRQIMCTGDNVLTAISVGRESRMVPEDMRVFVPRLVRRKELTPAERAGISNGSGNETDSGDTGALGMRAMVVWEDAEDELRVLDPYTLEPRLAKCQVKERLVTSDMADTAEEMEQQQEQYFGWLHNYTSTDAKLTSTGNYCVAVTGEVFRFMMDEAPELTVGRMLMRGAVYARMSPDEKAELVEQLQAIGYCTGFCGDGANDCGALRAADVGLSLSEAEASVAAPFTSHSTDIECVLEVIREGRAALVTSFSCFKYMALYSIIQFTSVSMLYEFGGGLGDFQFLYIDLFIIVPLAVFMGRTPAFSRIAPKRPTANLMSKKVLTSMFGQIIINSTIQAILFRLVKQSDHYQPPVREDPSDLNTLLIRSFENTALFLASSFQYILVACVFSIGPPYRQSNLRNYGLVITCALLIVFTVFLTLYPNDRANSVFELIDISSGFRRTIIVWAAINFGLSAAGEKWVFPRIAPTMARAVRIARYLANRYIWRSHGSYKILSAGEGHIGEGDDLEYGGHRSPTWEEIGQKTDIKPYKRILREMGIPAWY